MKIIGLDIGEKRIGVATADTSVKIATPHSTVSVDGTEIETILKIMSNAGTNLVVVGLPRNSKGEQTAQSEIVRRFATKLQSRGARIKFQDESLTSVLSERRLKLRKKPYSKEEIDREAATIILQDFIESFSPKGQNLQTFTTGLSQNKRSEKRPSLKTSIFAILTIALVAFSSLSAIWFTTNTRPLANHPLRQTFTVTAGESTSQIARNLKSAGLIRDQLTFTLAAHMTGAKIPAKTHHISPSETIWQILDQLTDKQT